jgi:hypothetical protein
MSAPFSDEDRKWIEAIRDWWGSPIVPIYKLPDGSVNAAATLYRLMQAHGIHKGKEND